MPSSVTIVCARCTSANFGTDRFCVGCGLPIGGAQPDADAGADALGPYEAPEPADPDVARAIHVFLHRSGSPLAPSGRGWRTTVILGGDRRQAVYVGPAGIDAERRALVAFVSVCGPVVERDCRILLKLNARMIDGCFAIRVLRGEEYFVFVENLPVELLPHLDAADVLRRIAAAADGLEDRLSRGRDIY
ncbi:YbjN domain-containing protein [Paludisphaera soli]|uniref:YbjN domain-containing protein n=1 Tax=Paludisphaera soli TaxID=2712865 RepID=UPI0013EAF223|nr:YbjN domain-containing protein [Paludisphaera soli]